MRKVVARILPDTWLGFSKILYTPSPHTFASNNPFSNEVTYAAIPLKTVYGQLLTPTPATQYLSDALWYDSLNPFNGHPFSPYATKKIILTIFSNGNVSVKPWTCPHF
jgi:hypothetical protein